MNKEWIKFYSINMDILVLKTNVHSAAKQVATMSVFQSHCGRYVSLWEV